MMPSSLSPLNGQITFYKMLRVSSEESKSVRILLTFCFNRPFTSQNSKKLSFEILELASEKQFQEIRATKSQPHGTSSLFLDPSGTSSPFGISCEILD